MLIVYVIITIFVVCGIFLLFGKGSWLIAGYNTASKEEKEKIDEKKLCKSMGVMLLMIAAIMGAIAYVNTDAFAVKMIIPIFIVVGLELLYANKFCNRKL